MLNRYRRKILIGFMGAFFVGCGLEANEIKNLSKEFQDYWYAGQAELTRYKLTQARYGEYHEGHAVLVFVTEHFLADKQVKHEFGSNRSEPILKLNFTKNFNTGIYPYSMMTSVFTPIGGKHEKTFKTSTSVQEWCGHTYTQFNLKKDIYDVKLHSYFQKEADQELNIKAVLLEDEIWTRIRLAPMSLPVGDIEIIPGSQYARLLHKDLKVEKAKAEWREIGGPERLKAYTVTYKNIKRVLEITIEDNFPYTIISWEEKTSPVFGNKKWMTTKAVRTHSMMSKYWSKHLNKDLPLRKKLGLN